MELRVRPTALAEVVVIEPRVFADARGFFFESWNRSRYAEAVGGLEFVQDNVSRSQHGTLRGLHLQHPHQQGKLVHVIDGEVFDVAVDVRVGSPTFGRWVGEYLSSSNHRQVYVPPGFAHGFCVTSASALFCYKCTDTYHPEAEVSVAWDDPTIGIQWPVEAPTLSKKDAEAPHLGSLAPDRLPHWRG